MAALQHKTKNLTNAEFKKKANTRHSNRYDYTKTNYVNKRTKVVIICPDHGEFQQVPTQHLQGKGCKLCEKRKLLGEEFKQKARKLHHKHFKYNCMKNYIDDWHYVYIYCPIHGEFLQRPYDHLNNENVFLLSFCS